MAELREYEFRVESRDVDFMKQSTVMALGDYMLNTAGEDADRNGFGVRKLNSLHNSSWVLTRMAIEVFRMPAEHELLRIQTWVSEVTRIMTTRNFRVLSASGKLLAASVTNWAMINLDTRKPMDLTALDSYDGMTQDIPCPVGKPARLEAPSGGTTYEHTVVYSDIDFNCHANSMKYLQWAVDTIPIDLIRDKRFARVDINFIQESLHGQRLTIAADNGEDRLFEIRNEESRPVCRLRITLK